MNIEEFSIDGGYNSCVLPKGLFVCLFVIHPQSSPRMCLVLTVVIIYEFQPNVLQFVYIIHPQLSPRIMGSVLIVVVIHEIQPKVCQFVFVMHPQLSSRMGLVLIVVVIYEFQPKVCQFVCYTPPVVSSHGFNGGISIYEGCTRFINFHYSPFLLSKRVQFLMRNCLGVVAGFPVSVTFETSRGRPIPHF